MSTKPAFFSALATELMDGMTHWHGADNWDAERFGPYRTTLRSSVVTMVNRRLLRVGSIVPRVSAAERAELEERLDRLHDGLAELYASLEDERSRHTLVKVWAYRLLGFRRVKLPLNTPIYWQRRDELARLQRGKFELESGMAGIVLRQMDLTSIGWPIELYSTPAAVMATLVLRQYSYDGTAPSIAPSPGGCVIDAGGCWGDTALLFARQVGDTGQVHTFEFTPSNLAILNRNLEMNPTLRNRINVVPKALWTGSDVKLSFDARGPGTSVRASAVAGLSPETVVATSIDEYADQSGLRRIDFIKMDIEGAELNALRGAERTLRRFRPQLAVAVYHNDEDFVVIPQFLRELDVGYKFFLDHFTIFDEETILFATASAT